MLSVTNSYNKKMMRQTIKIVIEVAIYMNNMHWLFDVCLAINIEIVENNLIYVIKDLFREKLSGLFGKTFIVLQGTRVQIVIKGAKLIQ